MDEFLSYLQNLSNNADIPMKVCIGDNIPCCFNFFEEDKPSVQFAPVNGENISITIYENFSSSIGLLRYIIYNKYRELFCLKDKIFADIIEGRNEDAEQASRLFPYLNKNSTLFIVSIKGDLKDALDILQELYNKQNALCISYKNNLVIWGIFEDVEEHAVSIHDSIVTNLFCKCSVCFSKPINSIEELRYEYGKIIECLMLKSHFNIEDDILYYDKLLFQKIIYHVSDDIKKELLNKLKPVMDSFDNEIVNTIEQFFNNDLNISETAKNLYVHRNTLIYRLDKINRETGYDIRNFKEAALFLITFLIWKESRR